MMAFPSPHDFLPSVSGFTLTSESVTDGGAPGREQIGGFMGAGVLTFRPS
jgi:hypothetical protein